MCYKTESESNFKKEDHAGNVYPFQYDMTICYLEEALNTESKKEEQAPKISARFLNENINADQRRIIVGYLIHLGVSKTYCNR